MIRLLLIDGTWFVIDMREMHRVKALWENYIESNGRNTVEHIRMSPSGDLFIPLSMIQGFSIQTEEQLLESWADEKRYEEMRNSVYERKDWE